ncbi:DNA repair protein RadC [Marinilongibacter aquaticus]|uniref:RadC family protein n=1 Tax=Marinilongibacter aquaticus TaxID=2975157 RepID=UPI0021BDC1A3|nr:DNA repair protein RadC [Marinilongibacter aquaticus]UBM58488.1 DNA repair protein RadC [Marinilongibacter aquaticus]
MQNSTHRPILAWAEEDRPREKLLLQGPKALSNAEILAILIGSGSREKTAVELSRDILSHFDNNLDVLASASVDKLMQFKGIGEAKAIAIASALELGRRRKESRLEEKPVLNTSEKAYIYFKHLFYDLSHEEFWIVLLDKALKPIRPVQIGRGGVSAVIADPKLIFKPAIESLSSALFIFHNHPSGRLLPSDADMQLTKNMKRVAEILDIKLIDHLIFTNKGYFSFSDQNML